MKPVLITGALGFIGKHLARHLVAQKISVVGIGHGMAPMNPTSDLGLSGWLNGDVDSSNLQQLSAEFGEFSHVYHLAGGSHVGRSYQNPAEDFRRTVQSGSHLLEWARLNNSAARILIVSSAAVYGTGHQGPIGEADRTKPFSPYGSNKMILETLCRSYCENFGLKIAIARLFSVYGEGLEKQLIFDLCRRLDQSQNSLILGGDGTELRDWIHVSDVVKLLPKLTDHCTKDCLTVNVGTGTAVSVAEVAQQVLDAWGSDNKVIFSGDVRRGDPKSLVADTARLQSIGFAPVVTTNVGFQRVVDWYRSTWKTSKV